MVETENEWCREAFLKTGEVVIDNEIYPIEIKCDIEQQWKQIQVRNKSKINA